MLRLSNRPKERPKAVKPRSGGNLGRGKVRRAWHPVSCGKDHMGKGGSNKRKSDQWMTQK